MSFICAFVFLLLGIKSLLLNIEYLFVFVKCYLQFFPHTLNQSTQKLPIIHIINQNHFFAPSYGDSISASSIIFTATGTYFYQKSVIIYSTKKLSTVIKNDFSHHYPTADFIQSSFSVQNIFFSITIFSPISTIFLHYTNYSTTLNYDSCFSSGIISSKSASSISIILSSLLASLKSP